MTRPDYTNWNGWKADVIPALRTQLFNMRWCFRHNSEPYRLGATTGSTHACGTGLNISYLREVLVH